MIILEQSNCKEHWMDMRKIYFGNIISYRLFRYFESLQRPTYAKLCVLSSKKRTTHIQRFCLRNLYSILDHGNIYGIQLVKHYGLRFNYFDYVGVEQSLVRQEHWMYMKKISWISLARLQAFYMFWIIPKNQ